MLGHFYIRRALRTLPVYYAAVAIGVAANVDPFRDLFLWFVLHVSNFYIWTHSAWIASASHFWSLAVEEQFYLVWPLLILFVPGRMLAQLCLATIAVAWVSLYFTFSRTGPYYLFLPTSMAGYLAMGALMAVLARSHGLEVTERRMRPGAVIGACAYLANLSPTFRQLVRQEALVLILYVTCNAMLLAWLVVAAASGVRIVTAIFNWRPLRFTGLISYSLYVVHYPMLGFVGGVFPGRIDEVIGIVLSYALAVLSFRYFESPIRSLRRKFHYGDAGSIPR